jgi:hypothetical protein
MKQLITFIFLFTCLASFGQTDNPQQDKWKIGLVLSPDHHFSNSVSFGDETGYHLRQHGLKYTAGVIAQLAIKPKLEIGTGIGYSNKDHSEFYYFPMDPTIDYILFDSELNLRYIEIPVTARYNFFKTLHFHVETGLINGFLASNQNTRYERRLPIHKFLLSGEFGLGLNYDVEKRSNFSMTAFYRQSLTAFADNASSKLRSVGVMIGITWKIKKNA